MEAAAFFRTLVPDYIASYPADNRIALLLVPHSAGIKLYENTDLY
jgi:hypothetical protein